MKPIKQTVYFETESSHMEYVERKEGYFFTPEELNEYTTNVIEQALKSAADEAECKTEETEDYYTIWVDKDSIIDAFDDVFKKFEV